MSNPFEEQGAPPPSEQAPTDQPTHQEEGPSQAELDMQRGQEIASAAAAPFRQGAEAVRNVNAGIDRGVYNAGRELGKWGAEKLEGAKEKFNNGKERVKGLFAWGKERAQATFASIKSMPERVGNFALRKLGTSERVGKELAEKAAVKTAELSKATVDGVTRFGNNVGESYNRTADRMGGIVENFLVRQAEKRLLAKFAPELQSTIDQIAHIRSGEYAKAMRANAASNLEMAAKSGNLALALEAMAAWNSLEDSLTEFIAKTLEDAHANFDALLARREELRAELRNRGKEVEEQPTAESIPAPEEAAPEQPTTEESQPIQPPELEVPSYAA